MDGTAVIDVDGIKVEYRQGTSNGATDRPPLVFVHGGCHGSWCWERVMPYLAAQGWDGYALNWRSHHGSRELPLERFIRRGLAEVAEDVAQVVAHLGQRPILVGHSMGGLVSQKYAESHAVAGLVLIAPGLPLQAGGGRRVDIPLDMSQPWGPPPLEVSKELFFQGCTDEEAERYHQLLCAESPQCVFEVTRGWLVPVDNTRVSGPVLVFGNELDRTVAPDQFRAVADYYGADFEFFFGRGHNLLLDDRWQETADGIARWLRRTFPDA
jgi:pimeloyl-ACP methyl ester carboxylesterase